MVVTITAVPAVVVEPPAPPVRILVTGRAVRGGTLLMIEDLLPRDVPAGKEPAGSFRDTIADRDLLRGAMVRRGLDLNEEILRADVLRPGDRGFLAAVLQKGTRAVTVGVDPVSGTAGLIWPGDRVDLVLTQSSEEKDQPIDRRIFSETILADVRVIAVDQQLVQGGQSTGQNIQTASATNRTVTPETAPFDAERITTAARMGKLSLVIRTVDGEMERPAAGASAAGCVATTQVAELTVTIKQQDYDSSNLGCGAASRPVADGVPIARSGSVSPALSERPAFKAGSSMRVHIGNKVAKEVKF